MLLVSVNSNTDFPNSTPHLEHSPGPPGCILSLYGRRKPGCSARSGGKKTAFFDRESEKRKREREFIQGYVGVYKCMNKGTVEDM